MVLSLAEYGGFGSVAGKIETDIKINHEGEVNRCVCVCVCVSLLGGEIKVIAVDLYFRIVFVVIFRVSLLRI